MVVDKQIRTEERLSMSLHVVLTSDFSTKPGNYFVLQYQLHLKIGMVLTNIYTLDYPRILLL